MASMALRKGKGPDTMKVRRGKVGGFRDYFDAEQIHVMESMVAAGIEPSLGYFQSESTAKTDRNRVTTLLANP